MCHQFARLASLYAVIPRFFCWAELLAFLRAWISFTWLIFFFFFFFLEGTSLATEPRLLSQLCLPCFLLPYWFSSRQACCSYRNDGILELLAWGAMGRYPSIYLGRRTRSIGQLHHEVKAIVATVKDTIDSFGAVALRYNCTAHHPAHELVAPTSLACHTSGRRSCIALHMPYTQGPWNWPAFPPKLNRFSRETDFRSEAVDIE